MRVAEWMVFSLLVAAALTAGATALEQACRRVQWPARFVWVGAIVVSVAWPIVGVALAFRRAANAAPAIALLPISIDVTRMVANPAAGVGDGNVTRMLTSGLIAGWIVISALLLGRMALAIRRIGRERIAWRTESVDGIPVRVSADLGPAVVGLVRPEIVLPEWTLALDMPLRALMLRHEVEHCDAGDQRLLFIAALLWACVPWNPALLFQGRRLRLAVEMDCDGRVLARHAEHDRYGRLLITIAQRQSNLPSALAPTLSEPVSHLERRIRAMTSNSWRFARVRAVGFTLVGAAAVVAACAVHTPDQVTGPKQSPAERAAMAANPSTTFYSYDVDTQAALTPSDRPPHYPDKLRASNIQGEVIAQFVVNPDGRVDTSTFKVIRSSDDLFTQSVRQTVADWTYSPAQVQGHPVKQLVQQPFTFHLNGAGAVSAKVGAPSRPGANTSNVTHPGAGNSYFEFKIDSGAKLMPGNVLPHYPDALASARTEGEVVARFVVDANGRVDTTSFQLLKSTDERFAQAVKRAAATWAYRPAMTGGHAVRQLVTMPVYFSLTNDHDALPGAIVVTPSGN